MVRGFSSSHLVVFTAGLVTGPLLWGFAQRKPGVDDTASLHTVRAMRGLTDVHTGEPKLLDDGATTIGSSTTIPTPPVTAVRERVDPSTLVPCPTIPATALPLRQGSDQLDASATTPTDAGGNTWESLVDESCGSLLRPTLDNASSPPRIHFAILTTNFSQQHHPDRRQNVERILKEFPYFEIDIGLRGDANLDEINDVLDTHGVGCSHFPRNQFGYDMAIRLGRIALWATTLKQWTALIKQRDKYDAAVILQDDFTYTAEVDEKIRTLLTNHKRWFPGQVSMPWYSFAHGDSANVYQIAALPSMMCEVNRMFKHNPIIGLDTFFDENGMAAENSNFGVFRNLNSAHFSSTLWTQPIVLCRDGRLVYQTSPFERSAPGPPLAKDDPEASSPPPPLPCLKVRDACVDFTRRDEQTVAELVGSQWQWNGSFALEFLPDGRVVTSAQGPLNCWGSTAMLRQSCWWAATSQSVFVYFGESRDFFEMKVPRNTSTTNGTNVVDATNAPAAVAHTGKLEGVRVHNAEIVAMERA